MALDVRAEGQTQILSISNYLEEKSLFRRRLRPGAMGGTSSQMDNTANPSEAFEPVIEEDIPSLALVLDLEGVGISLMDKRLVEVLYVTFTKLDIKYTDSPVAQTIDLACNTIQVDNQFYEASYPVLLRAAPLPQGKNMSEGQPALQVSAVVVKDQGK